VKIRASIGRSKKPMDPRDKVDIPGIRLPPPSVRRVGEGAGQQEQAGGTDGNGPRRPFLQIWYRCCHVYGRLTKSDDGTHYSGRCPKCAAQLEVPVGEGGTNRRAFEAQ
jgi:hypothetical protein